MSMNRLSTLVARLARAVVTHRPSPRQATVVTFIGVIAADWIGSMLLGYGGIFPHLSGESGLLLVWAIGHCDGMDGPVVTLARKALAAKNVNLVLPWVPAQDEPEVREAFTHALAVRALSPQAERLADRHFFETLVRVHRAAEGAPYTGLKPAGRDLGPAIPAADQALRDHSLDTVEKLLSDAIHNGLHRRFHAAVEKQAFHVDDVAAGREYVAAYVTFIHYVERLWQAATESAHGHHAEHSHEH